MQFFKSQISVYSFCTIFVIFKQLFVFSCNKIMFFFIFKFFFSTNFLICFSCSHAAPFSSPAGKMFAIFLIWIH
uniref:Uncharacterized protein n=1 Tax=Daphnia magna TaxID=35525 RepID=A0A0P6H182_9CRUS